ncbi:MAG: pseudouridine synthase [Aureispira sp.]
MASQYYAIYKPFGMLSQFSREHPEHITLADLDFTFAKDVYPIGRLDKDSEGLLLLSNNRSINHTLLHPTNAHERSYWVQVDGQITLAALEQLRQGVSIKINKKSYPTRPAKAQLLATAPPVPDRQPPIRYRKNQPTSWIELTLIEGKNRQVRRMTAAVGFPTLRLVRHQIVQLAIDKWEAGAVHAIAPNDFQQLLELDKI